MGFTPWGPAAPLGQVAATPVAGFALQNGTPTICSWVVPNDGRQHRVLVIVSNLVGAVAETGGAVGWTVTNPGGGTTTGTQLLAGGSAANSSHHAIDAGIAEAGSTVSVVQNSALTAGGPVTCWAELWGS